MANEIVQVNFRMPADLKAALEREAERNRRTLTAEVVSRLEDSFPKYQTDMFEDQSKSHLRRSAITPSLPSSLLNNLDEEFIHELQEIFQRAALAAFEMSQRKAKDGED